MFPLCFFVENHDIRSQDFFRIGNSQVISFQNIIFFLTIFKLSTPILLKATHLTSATIEPTTHPQISAPGRSCRSPMLLPPPPRRAHLQVRLLHVGSPFFRAQDGWKPLQMEFTIVSTLASRSGSSTDIFIHIQDDKLLGHTKIATPELPLGHASGPRPPGSHLGRHSHWVKGFSPILRGGHLRPRWLGVNRT